MAFFDYRTTKNSEHLLKNEPGLKSYIAEAITKAYSDAVDLAVEETELPLSQFLNSCPYTEQQLLTRFYSDIYS